MAQDELENPRRLDSDTMAARGRLGGSMNTPAQQAARRENIRKAQEARRNR